MCSTWHVYPGIITVYVLLSVEQMSQIWFSCWHHHIGYDEKITTDGMYIGSTCGWMSHKFTPKGEAVSIHFIQNWSNLNCQFNMRFPFLSFTQMYFLQGAQLRMVICIAGGNRTDFECQLHLTLACITHVVNFYPTASCRRQLLPFQQAVLWSK